MDKNEIYDHQEDTNYISKMKELYEMISSNSQRAVMEQAFYLESISEIQAQSTNINEKKPYLFYDQITNDEIETICIEYDTAIALAVNIYEIFNKTQDLIIHSKSDLYEESKEKNFEFMHELKYFYHNVLNFYRNVLDFYDELKFKYTHYSKENDNDTINRITNLIRGTSDLIRGTYYKYDLTNIYKLLENQIELIAISLSLYSGDDSPTKIFFSTDKEIDFWNRYHSHLYDFKTNPLLWFFDVMKKVLSEQLYKYITSFHDCFKYHDKISAFMNLRKIKIFNDKKSCEAVRKCLQWDSINKETKIVCVAKMTYKGDVYWAVNGVEKEDENIQALKEVINPKNIVSINDNVCYYPKNYKPISYSAYKKAQTDENKRKNRLFSCCERKLITKLRSPNQSFRIDVVLPPCYMCENAFLYLKSKGANIEIHHSKLEIDDINHLKQLGLIK